MIPTWVPGGESAQRGVDVATQRLCLLVFSSTTPERLQTCSHILNLNNAESHKCGLKHTFFQATQQEGTEPKAVGGTNGPISSFVLCHKDGVHKDGTNSRRCTPLAGSVHPVRRWLLERRFGPIRSFNPRRSASTF